MNRKAVFLLSTIALFERLSYYGARSLFVIFATDVHGMNWGTEESLEYMAYFASAVFFCSLPISFLTDKFIGQQRSVVIGGILSVIGYSMLAIPQPISLLISAVLIIVGSNLVRPSATVLIGRLFDKRDRNRTLAYMIFYLGINVGSFLGVMWISWVGMTYGWSYGFLLAAASTLVYLLMMLVARTAIVEVESNRLAFSETRLTLKRSVQLLLIVILIQVFYWNTSGFYVSEIKIDLVTKTDLVFLGYEMSRSILQNLDSLFAMLFMIGLFFYWAIKGVSSFWTTIRWSFLLLLIAIVVSLFNGAPADDSSFVYFAMLPLVLFALSESLISAMLTSYVTRVSDVRYSNTLYSLFVLSGGAIGGGVMYLVPMDYQSVVLGIVVGLSLLFLFLFRNQIERLTKEID